MLHAMTRWHALRPVDEAYFTTAPLVYHYSVDAPVPAEDLWASLVSDESLAAWSPAVKSVRWTTPRPFGVGTTRDVTLAGGAVTVREKFFIWEDGRRYAFHAVESNRPGIKALAEDYVVSSTPGGSRLEWTVALEPAALKVTRFSSPLIKATFGRLAADGRKYFAKRG